jgi:hypothetical protein
MKQYKIQNQSQKNSQSWVPLSIQAVNDLTQTTRTLYAHSNLA